LLASDASDGPKPWACRKFLNQSRLYPNHDRNDLRSILF
jgi:hypothetical protein